MDLDGHDLVQIARRRGWIVLLAAIIVATTTLIYGSMREEQYTATARVMLLPATDIPDQYAALLASQSLTGTYLQLLTSDHILERVQADLELPYSLSELEERVRALTVQNSMVLEVRVTDSDAERAAAIATTLVEQFERYIHVPSAASPDGLTLTAPARVTDRAAVPSNKRVLETGTLVLVGAMAGAFAGIAIVATLEMMGGGNRQVTTGTSGRRETEPTQRLPSQGEIADVSSHG